MVRIKECQILLGPSSYQVVARGVVLEVTLCKIMRLAEFLVGKPCLPYKFFLRSAFNCVLLL